MSEYYDGTKLLSLKDINGNKPEIYICTGNRTAGKTTYFSRLCVNRFLDKGEKFMLIYRYKYELDDVSTVFFKDINELFFSDCTMTDKSKSKGVYHELYINEKSCGYAAALNSANSIKKLAHIFSDVKRMLYDEFQPEDNVYCDKEIDKFQSIHTSVARGQGEQVRYVPVYMVSNLVSLINPYYVAWGISSRIGKETKFLKGDGFVLESCFVESASNAQKNSGFNRAFSGNRYLRYSSENVYLNDNDAFIEKPTGFPRYIGTLKYEGVNYGIKEYGEQGIIYCDDKADNTFPLKISVTTDDHQINYIMLRNNDMFLMRLRFYFEHGCFRFKDLKCKDAILHALSY